MTSRAIFVASLAILMMACAPLPAAPPNPAIPASLSGRYLVPGDGGFLDLRPDGTFNISREKESSAGTYTVNGNSVTLTMPGAAMPPLQFANGVLTIGNGVKIPRVGEAAPPPAPGTTTSAIASSEQINAARSVNHAKQLGIAAKLWAADHQGNLPDSLEQLKTKDYAGADPRIWYCPLLNDDTQIGYVYLGKGLKDSAPGATIILLSKWSAPDGRRVIVRADLSAMVAVPKASDLPATVGVTVVPAKPPGAATSGPAGSAPATVPGGDAIPSNLAKITLSKNDNGKGRYGAIFPAEQMPADPKNYFWITARPDNKFNVMPLQQNTHFVALLPGIYKVSVEYRSGNMRQQVSNLVEVTAPATGQ